MALWISLRVFIQCLDAAYEPQLKIVSTCTIFTRLPIKFPEKPHGIYSESDRNFAELDHVEAAFASFVLGNKGLRTLQTGREFHLGEPRLQTHVYEQHAQLLTGVTRH